MMAKIISKGSEAKNMHFEIRRDIPAYLSELKIWLNEVRDIELEAMDDFFTARVDEYEDHMACWSEAYERMAALIPEGCRRLLDLGCGTGLELDKIFARFPDMCVTGIDLCASMLEVLKKKHADKLLTLRCEDYFEAELGISVYDAAISFETLHHFRPAKKGALFRNIYESLKLGGVYFECDYIACCEEEETLLLDECNRKRRLAGVPEDQFVHFDTPLTLKHETALLENAGFQEVAAIDCINGATLIKAVRR